MDNITVIGLHNIINENVQLKGENVQLKKSLDEYYVQHSNNFILIKQKEDEINILKKQNADLLIEIELLKTENAQLKIKICELEKIILEQNARILLLEAENREIKAENREIKAENREIKAENREIKYQLNRINNKDFINKLLFCIQDLNAIYKIEKNIKGTKLSELRNKRNDMCHYILDDENKFIKLKKIEFIIEKLNTIDNKNKNYIEKLYGKNLIQNIITFIQPKINADNKIIHNDVNLSQEIIDNELIEFWEF